MHSEVWSRRSTRTGSLNGKSTALTTLTMAASLQCLWSVSLFSIKLVQEETPVCSNVNFSGPPYEADWGFSDFAGWCSHPPQVTLSPFSSETPQVVQPLNNVPVCFFSYLHDRPPTGKRNLFTSWVNDFQFQAKKIDIFSRWIFPFTFLMFNIWYWSYYLSQAQSKAKKREES